VAKTSGGKILDRKETSLTTSPVILVILDGFGINPRKEGNAIAGASTPNLDALLQNYPNSRLSMSGVDVGLP
jgi:2,3-bisphosphoglycerate-independent phosphoglycerate mutase